ARSTLLRDVVRAGTDRGPGARLDAPGAGGSNGDLLPHHEDGLIPQGARADKRQARRSRAVPGVLDLCPDIFHHSNDAIAIIDASGAYSAQNPAHEALLGYSLKELKGITPAIHMGESFGRVVEIVAREGTYRGEVVSRTRTGKLVHIELSAFSVRDK